MITSKRPQKPGGAFGFSIAFSSAFLVRAELEIFKTEISVGKRAIDKR
jgi:hypothetical protein